MHQILANFQGLVDAILAVASIHQAAPTLAVQRSTISRWKKGRAPRSPENIAAAIKLALELGVDVGPYQSFTPIYDLSVERSYDDKRIVGPPDLSWLVNGGGIPTIADSVAGIPLTSPLGIASSPIVADERWATTMIDLYYGLITIKTRRSGPWPAWKPPHILRVVALPDLRSYDPTDPPIVEVEYPKDLRAVDNLVNSLGVPSEEPVDARAVYERLRRARPDARSVGISVMGDGDSPEKIVGDFEKAVREHLEVQPTYVELNVSCPNREKKGDFANDILLIGNICERVNKPIRRTGARLFLKLPYMPLRDMRRLVRAVGNHVDAIVYRNTLKVRPRLREHDGRLINAFLGREFGGLSGPGTFGVTLEGIKMLAKIRRDLRMKFDIVAVGGVTSADHVEDLISAEANAVQACTGPMFDPLLGWKAAFRRQESHAIAEAQKPLAPETPLEEQSFRNLQEALLQCKLRGREIPESRWVPLWNQYRNARPSTAEVTAGRIARLRTVADWLKELVS